MENGTNVYYDPNYKQEAYITNTQFVEALFRNKLTKQRFVAAQEK